MFNVILKFKASFCRKVLQDLCTLQYSVYEHDQLIEEKNSELIALKTASNQRIAKKELISVFLLH